MFPEKRDMQRKMYCLELFNFYTMRLYACIVYDNFLHWGQWEHIGPRPSGINWEFFSDCLAQLDTWKGIWFMALTLLIKPCHCLSGRKQGLWMEPNSMVWRNSLPTRALYIVLVAVVLTVFLALSWLLLLISYVLVNPFLPLDHPSTQPPQR